MSQQHSYGLWIVVVLLGYLSFLLLHTFWQYLAFALLFALLFATQFGALRERMHANLAALLLVLLVLLLLVIPTLYIVATTVQQAPAAYTNAIAAIDKPGVQHLLGVTSDEVRNLALTAGSKLKQSVLDNASVYISQVSDIILGLFIMFLTLFFLLRDGDRMYAYLLERIPVRRKVADSFFQEMRRIVYAVVLGQLVTALLQGALAGVAFAILGIPNPIFWGVITALVSIIPVLGPFLVYLPASAYLFLNDRYVAGVFMLIFGAIVLSQIDNVVRPYIASRATKIHPLTVILGVLGGLKLWGLVGFILGPIVLAAFLALVSFANRSLHAPA